MSNILSDLKDSLSEKMGHKQDVPIILHGELGAIVEGRKMVAVSEDSDRSYVRLRGADSEVVEALNLSVLKAYGIKVLVQWNGSYYEVLRVDSGAGQRYGGQALLPNHGNQHSFGYQSGSAGADPTWIYGRQFMPLALVPTNPFSMQAYVMPGYYVWNGVTQYFSGTYTDDLTYLSPIEEGFIKYLTVYLANGTVGYLTGTDFNPGGLAWEEILANIPMVDLDGGSMLGAVRFYLGQESLIWNDIWDLRPFTLGGAGVSSSSGAIMTLYLERPQCKYRLLPQNCVPSNCEVPPEGDVRTWQATIWTDGQHDFQDEDDPWSPAFITSEGSPNLSFLPASEITIVLNACTNAGGPTVTLQCKIWSVSALGVATLLGTTNTVTVAAYTSPVPQYLLTATCIDTPLNVTDRLKLSFHWGTNAYNYNGYVYFLCEYKNRVMFRNASTPGQLPVGNRKRQVLFTVEGDLVVNSGKLKVTNEFGYEMTLTEVSVRVDAAPSGTDAATFDVNVDGTTIFTNQAHRPELLQNTSYASTTVIDEPTWPTGSYLTFDVDQVGSVRPGSDLVLGIVCY